MLSTYRKHDVVLIICQNNASMRVEIAGANEKAQEVIGKTAEELAGTLLSDLLEESLNSHITEELRFTDPHEDLGDVLAKTHSMKIRIASGGMQEFRLRLVRSEVVEMNPTFHFVLQNEESQRENEAFKRILNENFKGHEIIDDKTGLPNRASLLKDLELVQHYKQKKHFSAAFAILRIDGGAQTREEIGASDMGQILTHIGQICRQQLRRDDQITLASGHSLGLILMDITPESCRIVTNRLRSAITAMPIIMNSGNRHDISVSLCFHMINTLIPEDMLQRCEEKLRTHDGADDTSLILEVA